MTVWMEGVRLIAQGWPVLPLSGEKAPLRGWCARCRRGCAGIRGCDCGQPCHGWYSSTRDTGTWLDWCQRRDVHGVAVSTGHAGITVIDVERGGEAWMRRSVQEGLLEPTRTVRSGSGGWHLYYTGSVPTRIKCRGEMVDVKSQGSYVVAWADWADYRIVLDLPMAQPGGELWQWCTPPETSSALPVPEVEEFLPGCRVPWRQTRVVVRRGEESVLACPDSGAGTALFSASSWLLREHVACGGPCHLEECQRILLEAAMSVGVPERYAVRQWERAEKLTGRQLADAG